jgi:nitrogen fixation protein FixH
MKLNWGTGIVVAFLIMISGIIYLVSIALSQNDDLVEKDYYQKSIEYQQHIEKVKRTDALPDEVILVQTADSLRLIFPTLGNHLEYSGQIHFYSPVEENRDLILAVNLNSVYSQIIDMKSLSGGRYLVKIDWSFNKTDYYQEEEIAVVSRSKQ